MKRISKRGFGPALAALLVSLACAPCAFAAGDSASVSGEGGFNKSGSEFSASSTITFGVEVDQITASVPLNMTVVAKANGGPLVVPPANTYVLKNKSPMDIHVVSVKGDLSGTSDTWKFGTSDYAAGTDPADKTVNELTFKLLGGALTLDGAVQNAAGTSWNVAAGSATTPTVLDLAPSGSTSKLNVSEQVANALKLTYVIAPGSLS